MRLKQEKFNCKSPTPVSSLVPHATHAAFSYTIIAFRDRQLVHKLLDCLKDLEKQEMY